MRTGSASEREGKMPLWHYARSGRAAHCVARIGPQQIIPDWQKQG